MNCAMQTSTSTSHGLTWNGLLASVSIRVTACSDTIRHPSDVIWGRAGERLEANPGGAAALRPLFGDLARSESARADSDLAHQSVGQDRHPVAGVAAEQDGAGHCSRSEAIANDVEHGIESRVVARAEGERELNRHLVLEIRQREPEQREAPFPDEGSRRHE